MPFFDLEHVTGTRSCEDYSRILSDNPVTIESQLAEAADLSVGLLMSPGTRLRCLLLDRIEVGAAAECRWRVTHQETKRSLQRRSFGSIHSRGTTSARAAVKALGSRIPIPKSLRSAARSLTSQDAYEDARCKYRVLERGKSPSHPCPNFCRAARFGSTVAVPSANRHAVQTLWTASALWALGVPGEMDMLEIASLHAGTLPPRFRALPSRKPG